MKINSWAIGKWTYLVLILASISIFAFFCYFINICPLDDISFIRSRIELGFWRSQLHWYYNWTGRYSLILFVHLTSYFYENVTYYRLIILFTILILPILIYVFLKIAQLKVQLDRHLLQYSKFVLCDFLHNLHPIIQQELLDSFEV